MIVWWTGLWTFLFFWHSTEWILRLSSKIVFIVQCIHFFFKDQMMMVLELQWKQNGHQNHQVQTVLTYVVLYFLFLLTIKLFCQPCSLQYGSFRSLYKFVKFTIIMWIFVFSLIYWSSSSCLFLIFSNTSNVQLLYIRYWILIVKYHLVLEGSFYMEIWFPPFAFLYLLYFYIQFFL